MRFSFTFQLACYMTLLILSGIQAQEPAESVPPAASASIPTAESKVRQIVHRYLTAAVEGKDEEAAKCTKAGQLPQSKSRFKARLEGLRKTYANLNKLVAEKVFVSQKDNVALVVSSLTELAEPTPLPGGQNDTKSRVFFYLERTESEWLIDEVQPRGFGPGGLDDHIAEQGAFLSRHPDASPDAKPSRDLIRLELRTTRGTTHVRLTSVLRRLEHLQQTIGCSLVIAADDSEEGEGVKAVVIAHQDTPYDAVLQLLKHLGDEGNIKSVELRLDRPRNVNDDSSVNLPGKGSPASVLLGGAVATEEVGSPVVVSLKHSVAASLVEEIQPLFNTAVIAVDERSNSLVVSGYRGPEVELRAKLRAIDELNSSRRPAKPISVGVFGIFPLQHARAADLRKLLISLYQQGASWRGDTFLAHSGSNSLLVHCRDLAQKAAIGDLISRLDKPTAKDLQRQWGPRTSQHAPPSAKSISDHDLEILGSAMSDGTHLNPAAADAAALDATRIGRDPYRHFEVQARALAEQDRHLRSTLGPKHPTRVKIRSELKRAVGLAFNARQEQQQNELTRLQERLARTRQLIEARSQMRDAVIRRRVEELLNPELRWKSEAEETSTAAPPPRGDGDAGMGVTMGIDQVDPKVTGATLASNVLDGTWRLVGSVGRGEPDNEWPRERIVYIAGTTWIHMRDGATGNQPNPCTLMAYSLDPTKLPNQIDIKAKGQEAEGIYRIEGDKLEVGFLPDQSRPSSFSDPNIYIETLQRESSTPPRKVIRDLLIKNYVRLKSQYLASGKEFDETFEFGLKHFEVDLALATSKVAKLSARRRHVLLLEELRDVVQSRVRSGNGATRDLEKVELELLEARSWFAGAIRSTEPGPPRIEGTILSTSGDESAVLVEISVGSDDGVRPRMILTTYDDQTETGHLEVVRVEQDRAVARVLTEKRPGAVKKGQRVVANQGSKSEPASSLNQGASLSNSVGPAAVSGIGGSRPDSSNEEAESAVRLRKVQVKFVRPQGAEGLLKIEDKSTAFVIPARTTLRLSSGQTAHLNITKLPDYAGAELFASLEVAPADPRTSAYLDHNTIPIEITAEDVEQVLSGSLVTKPIFLPKPEFAEVAAAGVDSLVTTRLDPGQDPIAEAKKRGYILAILRLGNRSFDEEPAEFPARDDERDVDEANSTPR